MKRRKFINQFLRNTLLTMITPVFFQNTLFAKSNWPDSTNRPVINDVNRLVQILTEFTEAYKNNSGNMYSRELACLKIQYPVCLCDIADNDSFAGRWTEPPVFFSPQAGVGGFGFCFNQNSYKQTLNHADLTEKNRKKLKEIGDFWRTENTQYKTRAAYPPAMKELLTSDKWNGESGIGFPLYRMSGTQLDYDKLIRLGIVGMKAEIKKHKVQVSGNSDAFRLYDYMIQTLDLFSEICLFYAGVVKQKQATAKNPKRQEELTVMEHTLRHIATKKPETLRQAIQLSFLYCLLSGSVNYGRMDEYLGDICAKELENKSLTEEEAIQLLMAYWHQIETRGFVFDSRVIVGGKQRRNEANADRFALLAMEATRRARSVVPQLTLRFYKGQNPELYDKALTVIGQGNTFPMLYNDDVNIPAVQKAFDITYDEAGNYVPFGCGEYTIYHKSVATPSGVINLLQALLVTLHNGTDPTTGKKTGLALGTADSFKTFDQLYAAYKKQVEHYVVQLARQEELEYQIAGKTAPFLFFSMLYDDCIETGKPVFAGGVRYLDGTLEAYGNTNTADSFTAIKQLVYEQKKFSLEELVNMLDHDFEGFDKARKQMLQAPKYGNDNEIADRMLVEIDRHICTVTRNQRENTNLHAYLIVIINNNANTVMGRYTTASPDGRKAFTYMANGNAPTGGADQQGVTAMLNSIVKPDTSLHAGAVQNLKFSKGMFTEHRQQLEALLATYFAKGGAQAMINVLGKEDLENAIKNPEKYSNLIVRVGGYSARFVELDKDIQQEILSRTIY